ncbi:uncharacterized protein LOC143933358 [Lithobates pipiens]
MATLMQRAGWVPLVLASLSLCATATPKPQVCQWTCNVTGRVDIIDETSMKHLATIYKGQLCPTGVTFNNCTACVNDKSNITISCQLSAKGSPRFLLELDGKKNHGETEVPEFIGCKEKVIENEKPDKQSERQRLGLFAPFLFVLCAAWVIFWLCKKPRSNRPSEETSLRSSTTAGPNGPCVPIAHPNGPRDPTAHPNGPRDPTAHPNGPCVPIAHPNGPRDPTAHPNGPRDPTAHPNGPRDPTAHPNGPRDPTAHPNGPRDPTAHPNGPRDPTAHPNGPCDPTAHPNGPCDPTAHPNGPCDPTAHPNGPCDPTAHPNGPCDPTAHPNGPCDPTAHPNGPCDPTAHPNGPSFHLLGKEILHGFPVFSKSTPKK